MQVKDLLQRLRLENPNATVIPLQDENGQVTLGVSLPDDVGVDTPLSQAEGQSHLGPHLDRIEKIRLAVRAYFGLPVVPRISENGGWVSLIVKSPTGRRLLSIEISLGYRMTNDHGGWQKGNLHSFRGEQTATLQTTDPAVAGYSFGVEPFEPLGEKLKSAVQSLCRAPKELEVEADEHF